MRYIPALLRWTEVRRVGAGWKGVEAEVNEREVSASNKVRVRREEHLGTNGDSEEKCDEEGWQRVCAGVRGCVGAVSSGDGEVVPRGI